MFSQNRTGTKYLYFLKYITLHFASYFNNYYKILIRVFYINILMLTKVQMVFRENLSDTFLRDYWRYHDETPQE